MATRRKPFDSLHLYSYKKMKKNKSQRIPPAEITQEKENEDEWETVEQMRDTAAWNWQSDMYADLLAVESTSISDSEAGLVNPVEADLKHIKFNPRAASSPIVKDIGMFENVQKSTKQVFGTFNSHDNYLKNKNFKGPKQAYKTFNSHVYYSKVNNKAKEIHSSLEESTIDLNLSNNGLALDEVISTIRSKASVSKNSIQSSNEILQEETVSFIKICHEISRISLEDVQNSLQIHTIQETRDPIKKLSKSELSPSNVTFIKCKSLAINSEKLSYRQGNDFIEAKSFSKFSNKQHSCGKSAYLNQSLEISVDGNISLKLSFKLCKKQSEYENSSKSIDFENIKHSKGKKKLKNKKYSHEISFKNFKMSQKFKLDRPRPSFARIKQHKKKLAKTPICCLTTLKGFNL